jgi:DNA polymerase-3 subunit gamma/tau
MEQIYQLIDLLNKTQQEMRWTNHPRIFLEVAIVKLCQMEVKHTEQANPAQIEQLITRIGQLESELQHLKANGVAVTSQDAAPQQQQQKQAQRSSKKGFQPAVGKINEILKQATKSDLNLIKTNWAELRASLLKSQAALLNDAEPIAASATAFIIKFKHEMICSMAMGRTDFLEAVNAALTKLTGKRFVILGVPEEQCLPIRESFLNSQDGEEANTSESPKEEEPHIAEAKKLFGAEFVEVID